MSNTSVASMSIKSAIQLLKDVPFLSQANPMATGKYKTFEGLTLEQFLAIQPEVSGCEFTESFEGSVNFMIARGDRLGAEADQNEENGNGYGLGAYCSFGYSLFDPDPDPDLEEGDPGSYPTLYLWYETTSGTLLLQGLNETPDGPVVDWHVLLPIERSEGNHRKSIDYAIAGRTREMQQEWHNAYLRTDTFNGAREYDEESTFHNLHMVPIGYEAMPTLVQYQRISSLNEALRSVHGQWATDYGIGEQVSDLVNENGCSAPKGKVPGQAETHQLLSVVLASLNEAAFGIQAMLDENGWQCTESQEDYEESV